MKKKTPSRTSPRPGNRRGCLCKNGKYSVKCCDGSLQAQGIGNITGNVDNVGNGGNQNQNQNQNQNN